MLDTEIIFNYLLINGINCFLVQFCTRDNLFINEHLVKLIIMFGNWLNKHWKDYIVITHLNRFIRTIFSQALMVWAIINIFLLIHLISHLQLITMDWIHVKYARMIKHDCSPYDRNYFKYIENIIGKNAFDWLYSKWTYHKN